MEPEALLVILAFGCVMWLLGFAMGKQFWRKG